MYSLKSIVLVGLFFAVLFYRHVLFVWSPTLLRTRFHYAVPPSCPDPSSVLDTHLEWQQRRWDSRAVYNFYHDPHAPMHHSSSWKMSDAEWETFVREGTTPLHISPHSTATLYEVGCGVGAYVSVVQRLYPRLNIMGSDLSDAVVFIANQRVRGTFCVASAHDLSYLKTQQFDYVISVAVLYAAARNEEQALGFLSSVVRLLRPGGRLFLGHNFHPDCCRDGQVGAGFLALRPSFFLEHAHHLGLVNVTFLDENVDQHTYNVYATRTFNS